MMSCKHEIVVLHLKTAQTTVKFPCLSSFQLINMLKLPLFCYLYVSFKGGSIF